MQAIWRRTASPATLLAHANAQLWQRESGDALASLAAVKLSNEEEVRLSVAGDPCVLYVNDKGAKALVDAETPLGLSTRLKPAERRFKLPRGGALVMTTSGVRDALDPRGRLFGARGIAQAIRGALTTKAQTLADVLADRLDAHTQGQAETDCSAIVICRR